MRILMLDNEFPPLGGGTGVVNHYLLEQLQNYPDVSIDLITSSRSRKIYRVEQFSERITLHYVPVDNRNIHHSSNSELLTYLWQSWRESQKLLEFKSYDLSFAFAGVPAGAISYALFKVRHIPYLVSLQGPDVPGFEARYRYLYPILTPGLKLIWANAGAVTAISKEHRRLAERTLSGIPIQVIYNGVDTEAFVPSRTRSPQPSVEILCVGRLIERKGQHHLLRALAHLNSQMQPRAKLTLVGTGDSESRLRALAADLGLVDQVEFRGYVDRKAMPEVYGQADIFVLPSQNEGMSIALLEAMSSGLPVIVTPTGGTDELVQDGHNGYIVPWANPAALAQALARLILDEPSRHRMGNSSRERALRFDWQIITKQYFDLCAAISAHGSNPSRARLERTRADSIHSIPL